MKINVAKFIHLAGSALKHLEKNYKEKKFYHIGPPRDFDLFKLFEKNKIDNLEQSNFILCTGLFEDIMKRLKIL